MKRRMLPFFLLALLAVLSGCAKQEENVESAYRIYYKNLNNTGLSYTGYDPEEGIEVSDLIQCLWEQLCSPPEDSERISVVPPDLTLEKAVIENASLSMYFNTAYKQLESVTELLLRTAIVRTFCQVDGIDSVQFYVGEQPLMDASFLPLGAQKATDYIDLLGRGLSNTQKTTLVLYYTNDDGTKLQKVTQEIVYETSYSIERDIIERLIAGPSAKDCYPTLPKTTTLISVNVKNGICYVNFDSAFVSDALEIDSYIPIYSLVNSLVERADIQKVQIAINGDSNVTFKDGISFAQPFERNLDYIGGE